MPDAYILGIESSCDETAAAVVRSGEQVISNVVASQFATHQPYGGVVPELASREHLRAASADARSAANVISSMSPLMRESTVPSFCATWRICSACECGIASC